MLLLAGAIPALPEQAGARRQAGASPYRALVAASMLVRRGPQSPAAAGLASALALFWIAGGAAVRARRTPAAFTRLLLLRTLACAGAGAALLFGVSGVLAAAQARQPLEVSLPLVAVFSALVYSCWKAWSLLLAVVEQVANWRSGWKIFARRWPHLAGFAASYSTVKWTALLAATGPLLLGWWRHPAWWWAAGLLLLPVITGYSAVRWRGTLSRLIRER